MLVLKYIFRKFIDRLFLVHSFKNPVFSPQSSWLFLLCLLLLIPTVSAFSAEVSLEWDPNTEPQLAGYRIYWGTSSGNYSNSYDVGNKTVCTIAGLFEGNTYYFAATAYDNENSESDFSNEVSYTVPISDTDGDGVPDDQDDFPTDPGETTDTDGDGIGNNADEDDDNDGMPDTWEIQYGFDPLVDDASEDADGDGVINLDEFQAGTNPKVPENNLEPDRPALLTPTDQQVVILTPMLQTDKFYDPDSSDFHSETQWQIIRETDNVYVFDITSAYSLTSLEVPKLILDEDTAYIWKARFYDNHGTPSAWSDNGSFTTKVNTDDTNSNGVPDHQEVETTSDLDGDGTLDSDQSTIKCVKTDDGKALGVSFKGSDTVVGIESIAVEEQNNPDMYGSAANNPDYFPFGLINFKLIMDQPGDPAEITVYFSEASPVAGKWYKYDSIEDTWTDYSAYAEFSADRRAVILYLEDGGAGDADGTVNGIIVDPSGVGLSGSLSFSGAGDESAVGPSCFIAAVVSPSNEKQPFKIWQEIRGRELAIFLVLIVLVKGVEILLMRLKQRR